MSQGWGGLVKVSGHHGFFTDPRSLIIYWRGTIAGKSRKISTGEKQISKAKKFIDNYRLGLTHESVEQSQRKIKGIKNPSIKTLYFECVNERSPKMSKRTKQAYNSTWKWKLEPYWGSLNLSDVSQKQVSSYENWFLEKFPKQKFSSARKYLGMVLRYMHDNGLVRKRLSVVDLDKVTASPDKPKIYRIYTNDEKEMLIKSAVDEKTRLALILYFNTGARKMEIISAQWDKVDLKNKTITLWSFKNKKYRTIPLSDPAFRALNLAYNERSGGSPYLFPVRGGKRHIAGQQFDKGWVKTKIKAGVKGKARVHDIRHTFATKTAIDNWPAPIACDVLDMTYKVYISTYVHIKAEDIVRHLRRSFK